MWWHWHQLGHMQIICTSLQTDNHASTTLLTFLQARCSSWRPTNSVKALKACIKYQMVLMLWSLQTATGVYSAALPLPPIPHILGKVCYSFLSCFCHNWCSFISSKITVCQIVFQLFTFTASKLLFGRREGELACKIRKVNFWKTSPDLK